MLLLSSSSMNRHGNVAHDYVNVISKMIYDEPCIFGMISMLQGFCLRHGIIVRWGQAPPTPAFQAHIQKYFVPFCKQAIQSFLAVGFAPFRSVIVYSFAIVLCYRSLLSFISLLSFSAIV